MRTQRVFLASSLLGIAALLVATGCGVTADDTAATVNGTVIKASLVNELASTDAFMSAMSSQALKDQRVGVLSGDDARQVLAFLVQKVLLAQEVQRWDAQVTDADRSAAEQTIDQQAPQLPPSQRSIVAEFLADRQALNTRLTKLGGASGSDLRKMYDALGPYWDQVCLTAVAVPAGAEREAERAIDRGSKLPELPKRVASVQVVATDRQCIPVGSLPVGLRAQVHGAAKGVVVGPVKGVYPGDEAVLWFVVGSRRHLSFEDARDQLRQIAASMAQQAVASWLSLKVNDGVMINPQYGTEVEVGQSGLSISAPALPLGATLDSGMPAGTSGGASSGTSGGASGGTSGGTSGGSAGTPPGP